MNIGIRTRVFPRFGGLFPFTLSVLVALTLGLRASKAAIEHFDFDYSNRDALLADGWSFTGLTREGLPRNTEQTSAGAVSYNQELHPGSLQIPIDEGSLWAAENATRNSLFRVLPSNWTSVRAAVAVVPTANYEALALAIYDDDDNFLQLSRTYVDGPAVMMFRETAGVPKTFFRTNELGAAPLILRLDRDRATDAITGSYSWDGENWNSLGRLRQTFAAPQLAIVVGGSQTASPSAEIYWVEVEDSNDPIPDVDPIGIVPRHLHFTTVEGVNPSLLQPVNLFHRTPTAQTWVASADVPWLQIEPASGTTPAEFKVSAITTGLGPGVYQGNITVSGPWDGGQPEVLAVSVIVNPGTPLRITTWKDGHRGAVSFSTDDSKTACYEELLAAGFQGTFFLMEAAAYPFAPEFHAMGMELGTHTVSHPQFPIPEKDFIFGELEPNIARVSLNVPLPPSQIAVHAWPWGTAPVYYQALAEDYFLAARGYNINSLEDPTPKRLYNLRSINDTHDGDGVLPPTTDFSVLVDKAELEGRWANFVFHEVCDDGGAIEHAATRDVWVAPIGTVIKYILQRDRLVVDGVTSLPDSLSVIYHRLPLPPSIYRNFEDAFLPTDVVTLEVDIDDSRDVASVIHNGAPIPYIVDVVCGNKVVQVELPITTETDNLVVHYGGVSAPRLATCPESVELVGAEGVNPAPVEVEVRNAGGGSLTAIATVEGDVPWLSVGPAEGGSASSILVSASVAGLATGVYRANILITSEEAENSPLSVPVQLTVNVAPGTFIMSYPSREALLADGWDFLARTASGAVRDTENTSGAVISYDQASHPGSLVIPVAQGDLFGAANDTRNSIFRDLPAFWSSIRLKVTFTTSQAWQQAGLAVYGNDDNYVQLTKIHTFNGPYLEFVREANGSGSIAATLSPAPAGPLYLRLDRDEAAGRIRGYYSLDGAQWTSLGNVSQIISNPRLAIITGTSPSGFPPAIIEYAQVIGTVAPTLAALPQSLSFSVFEGGIASPQTLTVLSAGLTAPWTVTPSAGTSWLHVSPTDGTGSGQVTVGVDATGLAPGSYSGTIIVASSQAVNSPVSVPVTLTVQNSQLGGVTQYDFNYPDRASLLEAGWDFLARTSLGGVRNTEQTSGAVASYDQSAHPNILRIPADAGDLWAGANDTRNSIFRDLPSGWNSVRLRFSFATVQAWQQAGLVLYVNDDNYVQITKIHTFTGPTIALVREVNGSPATLSSVPQSASSGLHFRFDRDSETGVLTGYYSLDGADWISLGNSPGLSNPRLGIIVGTSPSGFPNADLRWVQVITESTVPSLGIAPQQFNFTMSEGGTAAPRTLTVVAQGSPSFNWTATSDVSWLDLDPASGSGSGSVRVNVEAASLPPGTYSGLITVEAPQAANSPQTVPVELVIQAAPTGGGVTQYHFTYPDRASLVAAGWDFLARTPSGASRNTEQTSGAVVSFNQGLHPGLMRIPADAGDLWGSANNTRNSVFRDLPASWTSVRVKLSFATSQAWQQAGIVVYANDDNYVQITKIHTFTGPTLSFDREVNGVGQVVTSVPQTASGLYMRVDRNPSSGVMEAFYSLDGDNWSTLGSISQTISNPRLGIIVGTSPSGFPNADIEWAQVFTETSSPSIAIAPQTLSFTLAPSNTVSNKTLSITSQGGSFNWTVSASSGTPWLSAGPGSGSGAGSIDVGVDATGLTAGVYTGTVTVTAPGAANSPQIVPVQLTVGGGTPPAGTVRYDFTYSNRAGLLAGGWDFMARTSAGSPRNTEQTSGTVVSYDQVGHPGTLRIPADAGDLWASANNTRNSIFRDLPSNWISVRMRLSFATTQAWQQAGLVAYGNDDNYVQITKIHTFTGPSFTFAREVNGNAAVLASVSASGSSGLYFALNRNISTGIIEGLYSLDGTTWSALGSVSQSLSSPRVGIVVGTSPSGFPNADIQWVEVETAP